jgi:hypothetical protein
VESLAAATPITTTMATISAAAVMLTSAVSPASLLPVLQRELVSVALAAAAVPAFAAVALPVVTVALSSRFLFTAKILLFLLPSPSRNTHALEKA